MSTETLSRSPNGTDSFTGTWQLVRLALRRDRLVLPLWAIVLAVLPAASAGAYEQLYPSAQQRTGLTASLGDNPSIALLYGPAHDLSTAGGFTAWRLGTMLAVVLALVCAFTITRHTRQEEETGRQELLSSTILGRNASLTAALLVGVGFASLTGAATTVAMIGAGNAVGGSVTFGFGLSAVAWVFTGVAAVIAQLAEYTRTASGLAGAAIAITFALRAVGDSSSAEWLSWLSPIGWATQLHAFAGNRYWVLLIPLACTAALIVVAYALQGRRDTGLGLLAATLGPATAAPRLCSPFALAVRLHKGSLVGWLTGFLLVGILLGALAADIGEIVGDNEQMQDMLARMGHSEAMIDAYLASVAGMLGMVAALFAVQAVLRMRTEETALRADPLLTTGVSRPRWLAGHLVLAFGGTAALLAAAGLGMGVAHGLRVGDLAGQAPDVLLALLAQLPAALVVGGVAVALFGLLPAYSTGGWAVAAALLLLSMFGPVLNLGRAVLDVSPFEHVPKLPSVPFTATPLLWLTLAAAVLTVAGFVGLRRRDIG